jgi:hypothetical protein
VSPANIGALTNAEIGVIHDRLRLGRTIADYDVHRLLATIENRTSVMLAHAALIAELTEGQVARDEEIARLLENNENLRALCRYPGDAEVALVARVAQLEAALEAAQGALRDTIADASANADERDKALATVAMSVGESLRVAQLEAALRQIEEAKDLGGYTVTEDLHAMRAVARAALKGTP